MNTSLAQVFAVAPDAQLLVHADGRIAAANAQAECLFGFARTELVGKSVSSLLPQWLRGQACPAPGNTESWPTRILGPRAELIAKRRHGTAVPVEVTLSLVASQQGPLTLAVVRETSELEQAVNRLRRSEAGQAAILETALDAIICMDERGQVVEFNPAAERVFGFRRTEVLGRRLAELVIPPSMRAAHEKGLAGFLATGASTVLSKRVEVNALRANGAEFPVELAITPSRLDSSWIFTACVRDITERRAAECMVRAEHAVTQILGGASTVDEAGSRILRSICENLGWPLGLLWLTDANATMLRCAAAWHHPDVAVAGLAELSPTIAMPIGTGLSGRAWTMRTICWTSAVEDTCAHPQQLLAARCRAQGAIACPILQGNHRFGVMEFYYRDPQAPADSLLAVLTAIGSQVGQFFERRAAEVALERNREQMAQAQKMEAMGVLAGGIAHDFNNMLTAILGYADLLLLEPALSATVTDGISQIREAAERASSLTRQLLAFSRKQVNQPRILDLNAVISNLQRLLCRVIGENIHMESRLDPHLERIRADPGQIEQVIINLAVNARDAMPHQGGRLTFETTNVTLEREAVPGLPASRFVKLAVTDTGCGMTEEVMARAFDPFFTTKGVGKGTGLGLATVYGTVKQAGGHIEASSRVNQGTTFSIYLPIAIGAFDTSKLVSEPGQAVGGTETVLLVEDEPQVLRLSREVLRRLGYTLLEAKNGAEALRVCSARDQPIHLVVTDVLMPEVGGRELTEALACIHPETKVLFMSGYTPDAVVRQGVLDAEWPFIQKPFSASALASKVREVLDLTKAVEEIEARGSLSVP